MIVAPQWVLHVHHGTTISTIYNVLYNRIYVCFYVIFLHVTLNTINGVENCQRWVPLQVREGGGEHVARPQSPRFTRWLPNSIKAELAGLGTLSKNGPLQQHATTWGGRATKWTMVMYIEIHATTKTNHCSRCKTQ